MESALSFSVSMLRSLLSLEAMSPDNPLGRFCLLRGIKSIGLLWGPIDVNSWVKVNHKYLKKCVFGLEFQVCIRLDRERQGAEHKVVPTRLDVHTVIKFHSSDFR